MMKLSSPMILLLLLLLVLASASHQPATKLPRLSRALDSSRESNIGPTTNSDETAVMPPRGGGNDSGGLQQALMGSVVLAAIEKGTGYCLKKAGVDFPAMLGGCLALFSSLLLLNAVAAKQAAQTFDFLAPAAVFLTKWMPSFFVPGLVLLPLSPSVGGVGEIFKVLMVVGIGFLFTMSTSTFAVVAVRSAMGTLQGAKKRSVFSSMKRKVNKPKPFSKGVWALFAHGTIITAIVALLASRFGSYATPAATAFFVFFTLAAYVWSANLPADFVKIVHPLATSSVLVLWMVRAWGILTGSDFTSVLKTYRTKSLHPSQAGAGDILLYLLGPSVVAFALSVYQRRALLVQNLPSVVTAMVVSSAGSLFATAAFVSLLRLGGNLRNARLVRLSVLSRNVTTALSMALTAMIGGDISIAASVVCLTGILGGTYGVPFLNWLGVTDPISRGLGIGSAAQGLGVVAIAGEPDAFPFAAIAMVLTAIAATTLTSVPVFKDALVRTATAGLSTSVPVV